jgi:hypothetical protein
MYCFLTADTQMSTINEIQKAEDIGKSLMSTSETLLNIVLVVASIWIAIFLFSIFINWISKPEDDDEQTETPDTITESNPQVKTLANGLDVSAMLTHDDDGVILQVFSYAGEDIASFVPDDGQTILGVYDKDGQLFMRTEEDGYEIDWVWNPETRSFVQCESEEHEIDDSLQQS